MRLGILGGTFDPPHYGHIRLAESALKQLRLNKVLFAPVGVQPLKRDRVVSPAVHRARMVELAIAGTPPFELSRADLDRPGPHYSVDLIETIQRQHSGAALWFVIGEDSLADLLRWRDPVQLVALARLAVLHRLGFEPDWASLETALPGIRSWIDWIDAPEVDISSSAIRQRVRDGQPLDHLVSAAVAAYIVEQRLYL